MSILFVRIALYNTIIYYHWLAFWTLLQIVQFRFVLSCRCTHVQQNNLMRTPFHYRASPPAFQVVRRSTTVRARGMSGGGGGFAPPPPCKRYPDIWRVKRSISGISEIYFAFPQGGICPPPSMSGQFLPGTTSYAGQHPDRVLEKIDMRPGLNKPQ